MNEYKTFKCRGISRNINCHNGKPCYVFSPVMPSRAKCLYDDMPTRGWCVPRPVKPRHIKLKKKGQLDRWVKVKKEDGKSEEPL